MRRRSATVQMNHTAMAARTARRSATRCRTTSGANEATIDEPRGEGEQGGEDQADGFAILNPAYSCAKSTPAVEGVQAEEPARG